MERCLDCNSLLTREEMVCVECGKKVRGDEGSAADFAAGLISILFYVSLAALIVSPFIPRGPGVLFCFMISCALLFIMRTAKDSVEKVRRR